MFDFPLKYVNAFCDAVQEAVDEIKTWAVGIGVILLIVGACIYFG